MNRVLLVAIVAVTAAAAPNVNQGRWREIGKTSAGNPVFIDPKTVKKAADGIVTATFRVTFVKPPTTAKGPITSSRTTAMFDCVKKVVAVKENTFYHDEAANKVFQHSAPKIPGYGPAIKGTLPDVALAYVCK